MMERQQETSDLVRLPYGLRDDIKEVRRLAEGYQKGEVSREQFHHVRAAMGIYEQRQDGLYMMRVRLPGGIFLPDQMRLVADVARWRSSGSLHFTTRQDVQLHNIPITNLYPALVELARGGLSTKGGGGNTVRNVTACPSSGTCCSEMFDVTPHVLAVTDQLLAAPSSFHLPRKFKVAFSCCPTDCAGATVTDVGFIAKIKDGVRGFSVYAAGGLGSSSRVGHRIEEFVPETQVHLVTEAVKRVFDRHGNRENRRKARLRYVVIEQGVERFMEYYREALAEVTAEYAKNSSEDLNLTAPDAISNKSYPKPRNAENIDDTNATKPLSTDFHRWRERNVRAQRQQDLFTVNIPLPLGDIEPDALTALAATVSRYGEGILRATLSQDVSIRGVTTQQLPSIYKELSEFELANVYPPILSSAIACTGASTCRLGICQSQALLTAINQAIEDSDLELWDVDDIKLYINGCPNSCGRHPIASIGLMGCARRIGGYLVPHYTVQLGGRLGEGRTRLAEGDQKIPARRVPAFIVEYLSHFLQSDQNTDFDAFLESGGRETAAAIIEKYQVIPDHEDDPDFYCDWGTTEPVAVKTKTD